MKSLVIFVVLLAAVLAQHYHPYGPRPSRYQEDPNEHDCSLDLDPYACYSGYQRRMKSSGYQRRMKNYVYDWNYILELCKRLRPSACQHFKDRYNNRHG